MMIRGSIAVLLPALLAGCVAPRGERRANFVAVGTPSAPVGAVVFCADGAGGFGGTSAALRENLGPASSVRVEEFDWSHGKGRMLADHVDYCNILEQGRRLACAAQAQKRAMPDVPVYLIAHSAGSAVVLVAAESVPPGVVDRVVLLAPAVSSTYDLCPALSHTRIDAFISRSDWWILGVNTRLFGTTDRRWSTTSGRVGFRPVGTDPADLALYSRLRQHPWEPSMATNGNNGGHYGSYEGRYLRAYVLPLMPPRR